MNTSTGPRPTPSPTVSTLVIWARVRSNEHQRVQIGVRLHTDRLGELGIQSNRLLRLPRHARQPPHRPLPVAPLAGSQALQANARITREG
jgi:hypothetical protein